MSIWPVAKNLPSGRSQDFLSSVFHHGIISSVTGFPPILNLNHHQFRSRVFFTPTTHEWLYYALYSKASSFMPFIFCLFNHTITNSKSLLLSRVLQIYLLSLLNSLWIHNCFTHRRYKRGFPSQTYWSKSKGAEDVCFYQHLHSDFIDKTSKETAFRVCSRQLKVRSLFVSSSAKYCCGRSCNPIVKLGNCRE